MTAQALQAVQRATAPVHALVLDANGMSDIDYTGAKALGELVAELKHQGVGIGLARASHLVHHDLKHAGLLNAIGAGPAVCQRRGGGNACGAPAPPAPPQGAAKA